MDAGLADQVRLAPTITSEQDGRWVAIDEPRKEGHKNIVADSAVSGVTAEIGPPHLGAGNLEVEVYTLRHSETARRACHCQTATASS